MIWFKKKKQKKVEPPIYFKKTLAISLFTRSGEVYYYTEELDIVDYQLPLLKNPDAAVRIYLQSLMFHSSFHLPADKNGYVVIVRKDDINSLKVTEL